MQANCSNCTYHKPSLTAEPSTYRDSGTMLNAWYLENRQDFQPPRTYIAEQVYNVSGPIVPYLDFAPSHPQPQSHPPSTSPASHTPSTATVFRDAIVVSLSESRALPRGLGDRSTMAGHPMSGWWYCCRDNNLNNPILCGGRCTTCGHVKCDECRAAR